MIIDKAINKCISVAMNATHVKNLTNHIVVSAIVTKDENIILGINVPKSGVICSEMVCLGAALVNFSNVDLSQIVTISLDSVGNPFILNMCGNCRQNLSYVCPQIKVIIGELHQYQEIPLSNLLPYPYVKRK